MMGVMVPCGPYVIQRKGNTVTVMYQNRVIVTQEAGHVAELKLLFDLPDTIHKLRAIYWAGYLCGTLPKE